MPIGEGNKKRRITTNRYAFEHTQKILNAEKDILETLKKHEIALQTHPANRTPAQHYEIGELIKEINDSIEVAKRGHTSRRAKIEGGALIGGSGAIAATLWRKLGFWSVPAGISVATATNLGVSGVIDQLKPTGTELNRKLKPLIGSSRYRGKIRKGVTSVTETSWGRVNQVGADAHKKKAIQLIEWLAKSKKTNEKRFKRIEEMTFSRRRPE